MPIAKVTSKGQVTIPAETRKALGLEEGDDLLFEVQNGEARLKVIKRANLSELYGALPATRTYPGKAAIREETARQLAKSHSGSQAKRKKRG
jgi:AbrB family looped-hinge helix DNA binding protein